MVTTISTDFLKGAIVMFLLCFLSTYFGAFILFCLFAAVVFEKINTTDHRDDETLYGKRR